MRWHGGTLRKEIILSKEIYWFCMTPCVLKITLEIQILEMLEQKCTVTFCKTHCVLIPNKNVFPFIGANQIVGGVWRHVEAVKTSQVNKTENNTTGVETASFVTIEEKLPEKYKFLKKWYRNFSNFSHYFSKSISLHELLSINSSTKFRIGDEIIFRNWRLHWFDKLNLRPSKTKQKTRQILMIFIFQTKIVPFDWKLFCSKIL